MIYEKLQKARVKLQEMKLKKSGKNKFAGFDYFELRDFLPSVNKLFLDLKLCSNFSISNNIAMLKITDYEDDTNIVFTSPIEELELKGCNKIQALGGMHTYIKRYLYLNALEIVEDDSFDPLSGKENPKPKKQQETKKPTPKAELYKLFKAKGLTNEQMQEFCSFYKITDENIQNYLNSPDDFTLCIDNFIKGN